MSLLLNEGLSVVYLGCCFGQLCYFDPLRNGLITTSTSQSNTSKSLSKDKGKNLETEPSGSRVS